jgi:hypothetical protein
VAVVVEMINLVLVQAVVVAQVDLELELDLA